MSNNKKNALGKGLGSFFTNSKSKLTPTNHTIDMTASNNNFTNAPDNNQLSLTKEAKAAKNKTSKAPKSSQSSPNPSESITTNQIAETIANIPKITRKNKETISEIPLASIEANRYQPRTEFDETALEELRLSIKEYGIIQPLIVRSLGSDRYELIAGERRLRAAKLAGLKKAPVVVRMSSDAEIGEIALIENIQRENLSSIEEAKAYARLMQEFDLTQDKLSAKIGRSRSYIANFLRLLKLPSKVQDYIANGALSMGQAKPLLVLNNPKLEEEAAEYILQHELSARDSERLVKKLAKNPELLQGVKATEKASAKEKDVHVRAVEDRLIKALGTKVKIKQGTKKSFLEIEFYSPEELERLISIIESNGNIEKEEKIAALRRFSTQNFTV